jgi:general secretion pathway protein J
MDFNVVRYRSRHVKRNSRGFTLIELLVAITILAIVAVLGWRGLDSIIRTRTALTQEMEYTRGMQIAFAQLESDCAHAINASWFPQHPVLRTDESGLLMVRSVYDEDQPVRMQVVSYRLEGGVLTRRESPATRNLTELTTFWDTALAGTDLFTPVMLMSEIESAQIVAYPQTPGVTVIQFTGLQFSLRLRGFEFPMTKVFMLGMS